MTLTPSQRRAMFAREEWRLNAGKSVPMKQKDKETEYKFWLQEKKKYQEDVKKRRARGEFVREVTFR